RTVPSCAPRPCEWNKSETLPASGRKPLCKPRLSRTLRGVRYLKTDAAKREIDLHADITEYLRNYMAEEWDCCSTQQRVRPIFTLILKLAGSLHGSGRWDWTRNEWASTHSSFSVKHGFMEHAVWKS